MAPVINFTLPAVQLVCHLVALGTPSIDFTNSAVDLQLTPHPLPHQAKPLPDGYVSYPDIGVAYKVSTNMMNFFEANSLCAQEGAKLAVIDSSTKIEHLQRRVPDNFVHTGIIRMEGSAWIDINTGSVVSSLPWGSSEPSVSGNCAQFSSNAHGLASYPCELRAYYVCELPIPPDPAITAN